MNIEDTEKAAQDFLRVLHQNETTPADGWPDPTDFLKELSKPSLPGVLLPPVIEAFATEMGKKIGCDRIGIAMSCLVVCAAAIPDRVVVMRNDTWKESARLWGRAWTTGSCNA